MTSTVGSTCIVFGGSVTNFPGGKFMIACAGYCTSNKEVVSTNTSNAKIFFVFMVLSPYYFLGSGRTTV